MNESSDRNERRRFNGSERVALYVAAGGRCAGCGAELDRGWHGDHVQPYSKGGKTDVLNGQALCPGCNLRKGDGMDVVGSSKTTRVLRDWQVKGRRAFKDAVIDGKRNFLAVATPGAGKTVFALSCVLDARKSGFADRVVVVCPTEHLKVQWAAAAASMGLQLDPTRSNSDGLETSDYDGVCVTYAQVARAAHLHRMGAARTKTIVILDEIHHAGDAKSWGREMRYAFDEASLRLMLSGTPFRNAGDPMPFVSYEEGRSRADFSYGYARALADGVCRPVVFPSYDGEMEWWSDGEWKSAKLADELPEDEARNRLATALDPGGAWLKSMLINADAKLSQIRSGEHADAGGLIICRTQHDARKVAELLERITGVVPVVAVSDDPEASERIAAFSRSAERWIVAVKMVSEGVDIPRLRVGVYATNIITELFFRQAVGRFVRMQPDLKDQRAYFFIPRDDVLIGYAQTIKEERDHEAREELKDDLERTAREMEDRERQLSLFISGTSSEAIPDMVIFDEGIASAAEMEIVRRWRDEHPRYAHLADEDLLSLMQELAPHLFEEAKGSSERSEVEEKARIMHEEIKRSRDQVSRMSRRVAITTGREHAEIGWMLKQRTGSAAKDRTLAQHTECIRILSEILEGAEGGF